MSVSRAGSRCVGSTDFSPESFFERWEKGEISAPDGLDLEDAIKRAFFLEDDDAYVYHAIASVTLNQVQNAINHGGKSGLHAWYLDSEKKQIKPPAGPDIDSYTVVFASTTSTPKSLNAFKNDAKKGSLRSSVANHLLSNRVFPPDLIIPKLKRAHLNPYFDYWAWSCRVLEWTGPEPGTVNVRQSHHILPVFYHHFGCVCPSFEALEVIRKISAGRPILDVGSGNGYWTLMLRRMGLVVHPVDNGDSLWRTMWVGDTIKVDGAKYLHRNNRGQDAVLLLVYPQATTEFTKSTLDAFAGDTICIAGTQNANGFTAFQNITVEEYLAKHKSGFSKYLQSPLPSFAGKDEGFFVFKKNPVGSSHAA